MTYLERYQNGEHEAVWNELLVLGEAVRQDPTYSDAKAVAEETMRRVKRNIQTLYQRLKSIDYRFLHKEAVRDLPKQQSIEFLDKYEQKIGFLPISIRAWCEIVGWVDFQGEHPSLASFHTSKTISSKLNMFQVIHNSLINSLVKDPYSLKQIDTDINITEPRLPVRFKFAQYLMKNVIRSAKKRFEEEMDYKSDPLQINLELDINADEKYLQEDYQKFYIASILPMKDFYDYTVAPAGKFTRAIGLDSYMKANLRGGSYITFLPNNHADIKIYGINHFENYFVAYLRNSFEWGGFPMLANYPQRDESLIAFLKDGLEPI